MTTQSVSTRVCATLLGMWLAGCAATQALPPASAKSALHLALRGTDGGTHTLASLLGRNRWTVLLFYSDTCPSVKAHDERIKALVRHFRDARVGFYWLDSEAGASVTRDTVAARTRGYTFPILIDTNARVADALGARYASHAFILNDTGEVVYSGGIDSDKRTLHADAVPYLANALRRVLANERPQMSDVRALGCALQR